MTEELFNLEESERKEKMNKENSKNNFVSKPNSANLFAGFDRRNHHDFNSPGITASRWNYLPAVSSRPSFLGREMKNNPHAASSLLLIDDFKIAMPLLICFAICYALDTCCFAYVAAFHAAIALAPILFSLIGQGQFVCLHLVLRK